MTTAAKRTGTGTASDAMIAHQQAILQQIMNDTDGTINNAFSEAIAAVMPSAAAFRSAYGIEQARIASENAQDDQETASTSQPVSLHWLQTSGFLARFLSSIQDNMEKAQKETATTAATAQQQAYQAGRATSAAMVAQASGTPVSQVQMAPAGTSNNQQLTAGQQAAALLLASGDATPDSSQQAQQTTNAVKTGLIAGAMAGLSGQALMMGVQTVLQGALGTALGFGRNAVSDAAQNAMSATISSNGTLVTGWVWTCLFDDSCLGCIMADGSVHDIMDTMDSHKNCFPAGVMVSGPRTIGSTTRWYVGEVVEIETARGYILPVTPNHPILTSHGWVAAGLLKEGGDVISRTFRESGCASAVVDPQDYQVPAPIEQVAETFGGEFTVQSSPMPCAAEDFHGDGIGSEVYVVRSFRQLGSHVDRSIAQPLSQQHFGRRHTDLPFLSRARSLFSLSERSLPTTDGLVGSGNAVVPFFRSRLASGEARSLRHTTDVYVSLYQPKADSTPTHSKGQRDRLFSLPRRVPLDDFLRWNDDRFSEQSTLDQNSAQGMANGYVIPSSSSLQCFAGNVSADRILKIRRRHFSGHVYNLQNKEHWYTANNIIAHNCQCIEVPYSGPPDLAGIGTGYQWFTSQSDDAQLAILGPAKYEAYKAGDVSLLDLVTNEGGYIHERSLKSLGLDFRDYLALRPTAAERVAIPQIIGPHDFTAALTKEEEDLLAEAGQLAYAAELPEIPQIQGAGNTMGYQITDQGGAGAARIQELIGHEVTPEEIGGYVGAQKGDQITLQAYEYGLDDKPAVSFTVQSSDATLGDRTSGAYDFVRSLYRDTNGDLVMENESIGIHDAAMRGQSLGAKIFGEEVQNLSNLGVDRIETGAAGSAAELISNPKYAANGFYTWARFGYQTNLADLVDEGLDLDALHEAFPGVDTLQELMLQPGGPEYWRANGVSFRGTFDLADGSTSRQMLDGYLQAKGIELAPLAKGAELEEATVEVSPEVKALQDQRATLATQRDAAQAKLDTLSEKWRAAVLDQAKFDPEDDAEEYAAAEKKIQAIEKQQATQIKKISTTEGKMAKVDAKIQKISPVAQAAELPPEPEMPKLTAAYTLPEIDQEAENAVISAAQDALSGDGVASHADVMDLGPQIDSYLNDRIGPLADYAQDAFQMQALGKTTLFTPEQLAWYNGDNSLHGGISFFDAQVQYQAAMRDETARLLGQVRDVGGEIDLADGANAGIASAVDQMQQMLPSDWIAASNSQGELDLVGQTDKARGYYKANRDGSGAIALRTVGVNESDMQTLVVHELGHRMEDSTNGVWLLEKEFYNARTAGEDLVDIPADFKVVGKTRVDAWALEYMGKDPILVQRSAQMLDASGQKLRTIYHYELLSVGLEWLLGNDARGEYFLSQDPAFRQWLLGVLFGAKDHVV